VGKFELRPGWVTVSPLKGEDAPAVYAHELGHACSQIRRKLAIYRGSVNELKEYLDESCKITPDSERTYERLFASIGYADTTIECVKGIANNLVNDRFQVGKCKDGCPGTGIEESYAEGMALMSTPDEKWVPDLIPVYLCDGERDSGHPLSEDMFACLLKSPNVLGRVKRATQCKE
jgi:hypothetical protein